MKKTFILFCLILGSTISFSQIKVVEDPKSIQIGKVGGGSMSPFIASLEYYKGDTDINTFVLMYNNLKYATINDIKSLRFTATDDELNSFYEELKKSFESEKGSEKKFELGKESVWVKTIKNLGVTSLQITTSDEVTQGFFYLTLKQFTKLFGK